jgi:hypothetical protein
VLNAPGWAAFKTAKWARAAIWRWRHGLGRFDATCYLENRSLAMGLAEMVSVAAGSYMVARATMDPCSAPVTC